MVSSKKYEKCVKSVKSRMSKSCEKKKWKGKGCYNPWAICTKNLGGKPRRVGRPRKSKSKSRSRRRVGRPRKSKRKSRSRRSIGKPQKLKSKSKSRRRVGRPRKSKRKSRSRRSVGKPRKSKRKIRSRRRVEKPRKSKKSRRSSSSKDRCEKSSLKKYINRNGPPFPAQNCKGVSKTGNDGEKYKSKPDKNGIYKWNKVL